MQIAHRPSFSIAAPDSGRAIQYLTEPQLNALVEAFQRWYDGAKKAPSRKRRGRYWLTFLTLRFTGARLGEVLQVDDTLSINFREGTIRLPTLKRHNPKKRGHTRLVPVPHQLMAEIGTYLAEFPDMRGKVFRLDPGNFRRVFYQRASEAGIPRVLAHPHVLRHTRAIEMLRAGVPVTVVQDILGHAALTTTAVYLRISGQEARTILKDRGLI